MVSCVPFSQLYATLTKCLVPGHVVGQSDLHIYMSRRLIWNHGWSSAQESFRTRTWSATLPLGHLPTLVAVLRYRFVTSARHLSHFRELVRFVKAVLSSSLQPQSLPLSPYSWLPGSVDLNPRTHRRTKGRNTTNVRVFSLLPFVSWQPTLTRVLAPPSQTRFSLGMVYAALEEAEALSDAARQALASDAAEGPASRGQDSDAETGKADGPAQPSANAKPESSTARKAEVAPDSSDDDVVIIDAPQTVPAKGRKKKSATSRNPPKKRG